MHSLVLYELISMLVIIYDRWKVYMYLKYQSNNLPIKVKINTVIKNIIFFSWKKERGTTPVYI